jgi:hypothetical protein
MVDPSFLLPNLHKASEGKYQTNKQQGKLNDNEKELNRNLRRTNQCTWELGQKGI